MMVIQRREVRSQMDYILGSNRRIFQNVAVWDPRNNSEHYMVMGCLLYAYLGRHSNYLGRRTRLPPPSTQTSEKYAGRQDLP